MYRPMYSGCEFSRHTMQQPRLRSDSCGSKVQMSTGLRHVLCPLGTHSVCSTAHSFIIRLKPTGHFMYFQD